jgi:hypothetical protein
MLPKLFSFVFRVLLGSLIEFYRRMFGLLRVGSRRASPSISGVFASTMSPDAFCNTLLVCARRQKKQSEQTSAMAATIRVGPPATAATTQRRNRPERAVHPNSSTRKICPK